MFGRVGHCDRTGFPAYLGGSLPDPSPPSFVPTPPNTLSWLLPRTFIRHMGTTGLMLYTIYLPKHSVSQCAMMDVDILDRA